MNVENIVEISIKASYWRNSENIYEFRKKIEKRK